MTDNRIIRRDQAIAAGLTTYFSGVPCRRGHVAPRSVGPNNECQECKRVRDANRTAGRKAEKAEYDRAYRARTAERRREQRKRWLETNRDRTRAYLKQWAAQNSAKVRRYRADRSELRAAQSKAWRATNPAQAARNRVAYDAGRMARDLGYRLALKLRQRLAAAVRSGAKGGSAVRDLGCSIEQLRAHLERQFQPGMSWANWGRKGWHIDHIRPLASFDLTDPAQARTACHYRNLQPLWYADNISKGARADWCR